jgi:hypothetical protein
MPTPRHDWSRLDAMTEEQPHAAALDDPDAQPFADADSPSTPLPPSAAPLLHTDIGDGMAKAFQDSAQKALQAEREKGVAVAAPTLQDLAGLARGARPRNYRDRTDRI